MDKIKLRALSLEDAKVTYKWQNLDNIKKYYSGHPFPVSYEKEKQWIEKSVLSNTSNIVFGIERLDNCKLIGLSLLNNVNLIHRVAEFAIFIGDINSVGKGYAKEATIKTINFGFNKLGLNRIFLRVSIDNSPAINLYKKVGFISEGILRECFYINGEFIDKEVMSMLKKEFEKIYKSHEL